MSPISALLITLLITLFITSFITLFIVYSNNVINKMSSNASLYKSLKIKNKK